MADMNFDGRAIGRIESSILDVEDAPKQGDEGAPDADIVFDASVARAIEDVRVGDRLVVLTWLHHARRDVLAVHPRADPRNPVRGVFSTRSADRPNPIGLHTVEVLAVEGLRIRVSNLEAVDGTPVIDVKVDLEPIGQR